jgi:hypothetical protein
VDHASSSVEIEIEPLVEAADVDLIWYVGLDAAATAIGDALWNDEELEQTARERIVGLYRLTFRNAESCWTRPGRTHLSDIGHDARSDAPDETAESRNGAADRASRGGIVSSPAQATIPIGVLVERRKAQSQWIEFTWKPVAVLVGQPDAAP